MQDWARAENEDLWLDRLGGTVAARLATLKIWQASCIAGALTATWLAAIGQLAVPRPSTATPNARVADAFGGILPNVTTVLTNAGAAFPAQAIETKLDTGLSANAIVAAGFRAAAPDSVPPSDVTTSQEPMLQVASLEVAPPENSAKLQQDDPPVASPNPAEGKPSYLKYYAYSEIPPPEKPAKIALSMLSDVPVGTPVQEIERAAEAFDVDVNFMKAVAKIESDFNPRQRTGSYIGLFQLSKFEFSKYGSGDILNPRDNAMGAAYKFLSEAALFEIMTHKKPTFSDLYLIHQQGWEGAAQHISRPQRIAWKSMCATREGLAKGERWCKRAIWGNTLPTVKREWKSVDSLTSGAFVAMWRDRVDTLYARYPVLTAAAERAR
ncbi:transglycosylase SLT domain-containing protein [Bradyrhizobium sp. USDA 4486]